MNSSRVWRTLLLAAMVFYSIPGSSGMHVAISGGDSGGSGSTTINIEGYNNADINSMISVLGSDIIPDTKIKGHVQHFEQMHQVTDGSGKHAEVYAEVIDGQDITYSSVVLPKKGSTKKIYDQVSAEQWLSVGHADYIKSTASASGPNGADALLGSVGIELPDGGSIADNYNMAFADNARVNAYQTISSAAGTIINPCTSSSLGDQATEVNTIIESGSLSGYSSEAYATNYDPPNPFTYSDQMGHINGEFNSLAAADTETKIRTSNYGNVYDFDMRATVNQGTSSAIGYLGYYVDINNPIANKIQGAVDAADYDFADGIHIAPGIYKENVLIDKSVSIQGAGSEVTIVDGDKAGSVFSINKPDVQVTLSNMKITNGQTASGGGISNSGTLMIDSCVITDNSAPTEHGGGIWNGLNKLTIKDSTISDNNAGIYGGGIHNNGPLVIENCTISGNSAGLLGVGGHGGGISNAYNIATITDSIISGNVAPYGGGITDYYAGTVILKGCTITGNTAQYSDGGISIWHNLPGGQIVFITSLGTEIKWPSYDPEQLYGNNQG